MHFYIQKSEVVCYNKIMSYVITSSERNNKSASEHETKALLYLMNFHCKSEEISFFVIDFFNDVTGLNAFATEAYDIQSKANKGVSPKTIGRELVTLFKNFVSDFNFKSYILFLGGLADSIRKDSNKTEFCWDDITDKAKAKIKNGLIEECKSKSYINNATITDDNIDNFLRNVLFVINDKEKSDYIKGILNTSPLILPSNEVLDSIFDEIKDRQSSKKNTLVEGITINNLNQFIPFNRHIKASEIKLLVLNRIVNYDLMSKGIPGGFSDIYHSIDVRDRAIVIEDCKLAIAKTLFDKNNSDIFWIVFEDIYENLSLHPSYTIDEIYNNLNMNYVKMLNNLDIVSLKYFISIIKEGMYEN